MNISKVDNTNTNAISFKMKCKIIRLNPEKTKEWFVADRDFLNSTYQDQFIHGAVEALEPKEDLFLVRVGLPRTDNPAIVKKDNKYYESRSYDMFVDILKNGDENQKTSYDLSTKNVLLEWLNPMHEFEIHSEGPCNKLLKFIENLKNQHSN